MLNRNSSKTFPIFKNNNYVARLGITCLEWYLPKTRVSLTSDCLQKLEQVLKQLPSPKSFNLAFGLSYAMEKILEMQK